MKFQDDISNMNTHTHTDKPKPICPPLFQSWGHNKVSISCTYSILITLISTVFFFAICMQFKLSNFIQHGCILHLLLFLVLSTRKRVDYLRFVEIHHIG